MTELDNWKRAGNWFRYRSRAIFYRDEGNGPALLCLHGFPTASWDWHVVWPVLSHYFRVIAPDMVGFGFSDKPKDYNYSIMDQATLHEELLSLLGVKTCHVLAHDYGDTVTQELLARQNKRPDKRPFSMESVCFLNGGLFPERHKPRLIQKLLMTSIGPVVGRLINEKRFSHSFAAVFGPDTKPSSQELRLFWRLVSYNDGTAVAHRIIRYINERHDNRDRWVNALVETNVPLRFVNGPQDPVSGSHMATRYREIVPNPDVVSLDGIGHYPQIEEPEGTLRAFFQFMERVHEEAFPL